LRRTADLALFVLFTGLITATTFLPIPSELDFLRGGAGLLYVVTAPGYLLLSLLFPRAAPREEQESRGAGSDANSRGASNVSTPKRIDRLERAVLTVGASVTSTILLSFLVLLSPWRFGPVSLVVAIDLFVAVCLLGTIARRSRLPIEERAGISFRELFEWFETSARSRSRAENAATVLLLLCITLAGTGVYISDHVGSEPSSSTTQLSLLTEDTNGSLVAEDYPSRIGGESTQPLYLSITNYDGESTTYTVVALLQEARIEGESLRIQRSVPFRNFSRRLDAGDSWRFNHTVEPPFEGENVRLVYLLYRGPAPESPTADNAYREIHIWVNATTSAPSETEPLLTGEHRPT
jgi:uncharacterized membrane protein